MFWVLVFLLYCVVLLSFLWFFVLLFFCSGAFVLAFFFEFLVRLMLRLWYCSGAGALLLFFGVCAPVFLLWCFYFVFSLWCFFWRLLSFLLLRFGSNVFAFAFFSGDSRCWLSGVFDRLFFVRCFCIGRFALMALVF